MDITIKNLQKKIPIRTTRIKKIIQKICQYLNFQDVELSIAFVTASQMKSINHQFLGHNYVTDILTFDYRNQVQKKNRYLIIADIIISPQQAAIQALEFRSTINQEIELYLIHGLLHLTGYDDQNRKDRACMRQKENEVVVWLRNNK